MPYNSKHEELDIVPEHDGTWTVDKWDSNGNHLWSKNTPFYANAMDEYKRELHN